MGKIWCIKCKKEIPVDNTSALLTSFIGATTSIYCHNEKCSRYGLVTVFYLQEQTEAPKTAKPNSPEKPESKTVKKEG